MIECLRGVSSGIICSAIRPHSFVERPLRKERQTMPPRMLVVAPLVLCVPILLLPASAQLPPVKSDALNPAQNQTAACSTADASSCAQAAAKILPIVMGSSPLEGNLRRLTDEVGGRVTGTPEMAKAVAWAV